MTNGNSGEQKLKTFALMLKFNHDIFNAGSFDDAAMMAVNDTRIFLNFTSSSMWELNGRRATLAGQFGQTVVNAHSAQSAMQKKLVENLHFEDDVLVLDIEHGLPEELAAGNNTYFFLKLPVPRSEKESDRIFVWLLEYSGPLPGYTRSTAQVLGNSIANAFYFYRRESRKSWFSEKKLRRFAVWAAVIAAFSGIMFLRVPETTNADFVLKSEKTPAAYAWFDGPVSQCLKQDGDYVQRGDVIVKYDSQQMKYRLAMAEASMREVQAELNLEQQNAFTDREKLGKVKLLEAKLKTLAVAVKEAEWYLKHAEIKAPATGVLALADGRAELLTGKAVRTGDKLFEIYSGNGMIAEISVNEENSSVLQDDFKAELFLHTAPEKAIPVKIKDISKYPELNSAKIYCYTVKTELAPESMKFLRYGMRGVAKLSGRKVPLGYYLFKSMIFCFRSL